MHAKRFVGQVAVVTGGADGIGKAVARRLGLEGAHVALLDVNPGLLGATKTEFSRLELSVSTHVADVSNETSVQQTIADVVHAYNRIDIMINSAGIVGPTNIKITDYGADAFDKIYGVNLRGSFLMLKNVIPEMLKKNYGRILMIASIAGKDGNPGMCGYTSTKAGVIGLVKGVAKEYAQTGVTINALAPAVVRTALVEGCAPEQVAYMTEKIPMKRCATLDEVAGIATFIVSKECSFSTGFTFDLSGGRAVY
jgi:2-dehydro-3-deoxy-L-rhamnonate dehydrogenase (NAD+)